MTPAPAHPAPVSTRSPARAPSPEPSRIRPAVDPGHSPLARSNTPATGTQRATTAAAPEAAQHLRVELASDERSIHHVRTMVNAFVMLGTAYKGLAARLTLAAAQLAEHATKAERPGRMVLEVTLGARVGSGTVAVTSEASESEFAALTAELRTVSQGTAADAYSQALLSESERRLCLARVRFEGQLQLTLRRDGRRAILLADAG